MRPARAHEARVVSFDAGGTLFELAEPVGQTYARLARAHGFDVSAAALEEGFRRAFAAAPPLAAPPEQRHALLAFERAWWRQVVDASLQHAGGGADADPAARERFFDAAFAHYAEPEAWRLFPDVVPTIAALRAQGVELAVISNFDRRLHALLDRLGLADAVTLAVASSEAGAAKPDAAIFAYARQRLGDVAADACLHVGDSLREDVHGALAAGWRAVWLDRSGAPPADGPAVAPRRTTLAELPALVQSSGG